MPSLSFFTETQLDFRAAYNKPNVELHCITTLLDNDANTVFLQRNPAGFQGSLQKEWRSYIYQSILALKFSRHDK